MQIDHLYDHHNGAAVWERRGKQDWLFDVFSAPSVAVDKGFTSEIRSHVDREFQLDGWAIRPRLADETLMNVSALRNDLAFQIQTGNTSRGAYDLLKLQYLFQSQRIEGAAIAVPTNVASKRIGDNIANAERLRNEMELFDRVITVPILLVAFC